MSDGLPRGTTISCSRKAERYRLPYSDQSWVLLSLPDGSQWRLPLLEISSTGMAFGAEPGFPELPKGTVLPGVQLQVGKAFIRGDLRVEHITTGISTSTICGARFQPATDEDRAELLQLIEVLATVHKPKL